MATDTPPSSPLLAAVTAPSAPSSPVQHLPIGGASQWQAQQNALNYELQGITPTQWLEAAAQSRTLVEDSEGEDTAELQETCWAQIRQVMLKEGLVDEKLAMQKGEEAELLDQLLMAIDLQPSIQVQRWLLAKLVEAVQSNVVRMPLFKKLKGESMSWELQAMEDFRSSLTAPSRSEPTVEEPREMPGPGRRRQRKVAGVVIEAEVDEMLEHERIADEIIGYLLEQDLPNVKMAQATSTPWKILRGALGDTRMGTMKVYWRVWKSFITWLKMKRQMEWPLTHLMIVEYLHEAVHEPCARSHPQSLIQALAWMERAGGVKPADQLAKEPLLLRTVDFVIGKLSLGADPAKQAPRLPILLLASMECFVCNKWMPQYLRYRAFTILFKVWGTLRQDDIQHLSPGRLRMTSEAVVGELMRSKTTGATKRVKEVPLLVSASASITGMPWLQVGMKLISDFQLLERKYMLPTKGKPFGDRMARYAAASAATKAVTELLQRPRAVSRSASSTTPTSEVLWDFTQNELPLLPLELIDFWTEHSPRACMPSWAGLLGVEKSVRDLLGRWSPTGSEDYTRTYRLMVKKMQTDIIKAIRAGDDRLQEDDIWERLPRFIAEHPEQFAGFDAPKWISRWKKQTELFLNELKVKGPCVPTQATVNDDDEVTCVEDEWGFRPSHILPVPTENKPQEVQRAKKFVIVYSRNRKFARLHSTATNCPWSKAEVFDSSEVDVALPEQYDARCKICWPTRVKDLSEESDCWESDESADNA